MSISNTFTVNTMDDPIEGPRGKVGRFFYYAGEWNDFASTDDFDVTDAQAPYFHYDNNYWVFNPETNGTYTKQNMGTPSSSSSNWELMTDDFKYLITEAIFGSYAHFGSAIINGDWLISGNGTINGVLFKNGEEYNGVVAYTLFDPLFPYGIGNANVEINISEISWNYDSGNDIRAITDQYLLKAGRTYVVKILCHVERFYEGQQDDVFPKLLLWCPKDGVINDEAWIGETDASKYEEDQIFQKTINPASDGLYDIRAGLETNTTYGYGYVEMVVFECQTNTMFVPQYCVDLLSGETSMAGGKVQANRHGDFIIKGALMYSSLSQDRFILTNIDSTTSPDTYTYNLAKGVYEGQILSPKIPANYININGNLNYNNKSIYMIYLPPARLFEGMEITIISNARASNDGSQLVPLTFRVPTDFNTIDPVLDDATATVASTWNRFAVLYDGGGKISEGADGGIGGTHLVTRNANVIKLIATKHPFIEYYHPSQNSARQEAYNKKCIAWCAVDVK